MGLTSWCYGSWARYLGALREIGIDANGGQLEVLGEPVRLDDAEWTVMRRHPVIGHEILKGSASKYVRMGALIALGHPAEAEARRSRRPLAEITRWLE